MKKQTTLILPLLVWMSVVSFIFLGSPKAYADPNIYLAQGLNFGRIIPRSGSITIILDALGDRTPVCQPANECDITGGHPAALYFYEFGSLNIQLNIPSDIDLYTDTGARGATLRNIHMYSDMTPFIDGNRRIAYLGGALSTTTSAYGKDMSGTIHIEVVTF